METNNFSQIFPFAKYTMACANNRITLVTIGTYGIRKVL